MCSDTNMSSDGTLGIGPEHANATDLQFMLPAYIRTTSMIICILVMVLGVVGNLMVPLVVFRGKDMRNSTNIFLVNLSVADLCVLLVCAPTVLVEVNSRPEIWALGEHMCKYHIIYTWRRAGLHLQGLDSDDLRSTQRAH